MTFLFPVRPMHKGVFIDIVDRNVTQKDLGNGKVLHLLDEDSFGPNNPYDPVSGGRHRGVRPRWARILRVGSEVTEVNDGDLVLCDALKWTRGIPLGRVGMETVYFWRISVDDILLIDQRGDSAEYVKQIEDRLSQVEINIGRR